MHSVVSGQKIKKLNFCTCEILSTNEFCLFLVCILYNHYLQYQIRIRQTCNEMVSTQIQRSGVYQEVKLLWQLDFQGIANTSNKNFSAFIRHCFSKIVI